MREITVLGCKQDALKEQIISLYNTFKGIGRNEKVVFNLNTVSWTSPLVILPLTSYIYDTGSQAKLDESPIKSYLETINFPNGVDSVSSFGEMVLRDKDYIPISVRKKDDREKRERLESLFLEMIYKTLGNTKGTENAIYYPVTELVSNIFDHSRKSEGFVFGQIYRNKHFMDMCIVDRGRGLSQAFRDEKGEVFSDAEAIEKALQGLSTKPGIERGYGVRTSKRVVCEGLRGGFVIISGNSVFISVNDKQVIGTLKDFYWQGVIVSYRMPEPTQPIDITGYIE
jgi:anti-sigma regulatory factor (Ser/Thr protein kinase)